jgi:hypothetical protein
MAVVVVATTDVTLAVTDSKILEAVAATKAVTRTAAANATTIDIHTIFFCSNDLSVRNDNKPDASSFYVLPMSS